MDLLYAVGLFVGSQLVTIAWLKSDLRKHEEKHKDYVKTHLIPHEEIHGDIANLYNKTNEMMKRHEIEAVLKKEVAPLRQRMGSQANEIKDMAKSKC